MMRDMKGMLSCLALYEYEKVWLLFRAWLIGKPLKFEVQILIAVQDLELQKYSLSRPFQSPLVWRLS